MQKIWRERIGGAHRCESTRHPCRRDLTSSLIGLKEKEETAETSPGVLSGEERKEESRGVVIELTAICANSVKARIWGMSGELISGAGGLPENSRGDCISYKQIVFP